MSVRQTSDPAIEPVALEEAKAHLRVDDSVDDALITAIISASRQFIENELQSALIQRYYTLNLDELPSEIILPWPPLVSVTTLKYRDTDGVQTTMPATTYRTVANTRPGRIVLENGQSWPSTEHLPDSIEIVYVAGFGTAAASVPHAIRQAILLMTGHMYAFREPVITGTIVSQIPMTVESLLGPYKHGYLW